MSLHNKNDVKECAKNKIESEDVKHIRTLMISNERDSIRSNTDL